MGLNAADLDAITQEARVCFLEEDAPDYLAMLEQGMQAVYGLNPDDLTQLIPEYTNLMRAAHSLKGGAGIAQLPELSLISHRIEDLLEALCADRVSERPVAHELLSLGVEQINALVAQAIHSPDRAEENLSPSLMLALEEFLQQLPAPVGLTSGWSSELSSSATSHLVKTALETDLEDCLQRVEQDLSAPPARFRQTLIGFVEEGNLLGQALGLSWLTTLIGQASQALTQPDLPLSEVAIAVVAEIRHQRHQFLQALSQPLTVATSVEIPVIVPEPEPVVEVAEPIAIEPETAVAGIPSQRSGTLNLRIPVAKLDRMSNTVSELLINQERLSLYQNQFQQVSRALKKRVEQFGPIREQVQTVYDRMATPLATMVTDWVDGSEAESNGELINLPRIQEEFDPLQFDRYTELHSTLQDFQELMARVQETGADVDLLNRDLQDALDDLRQQLNSLRSELTDSRLVPFRLLSEKFIPALKTLNQRYRKLVELEIKGEEVMIDQVVMEQLNIPLTHLFRNAFDHGIESAAERRASDKPEISKISLSAKVVGNQLMLTISDDGRGVDLARVGQQAVKMGLCSSEQLSLLSREQLLEFLFSPGFSTTTVVSELSGRGVGLDVVRLQVERLRGTVVVDTTPGEGTRFVLTIPLILSILPMLLCQCQDITLAFPSVNVLEIISLAEYCDPARLPKEITWKDRKIALRPLLQLLPYQTMGKAQAAVPTISKLAIVIDVKGQPLAVTVDSLLQERELVLKPFDATVNVPAYLLGCSVLGTGQVVPVLSTLHFDQLIELQPQLPPLETEPVVLNYPETILIVDDSIAVRRLLDRLLTQGGYQVLACRDGKEALDELNRSMGGIAMVISDVEMPRMDGYSLLQEIRQHPRWGRLPVAMLTSRASEHHRQRALDLGATTYFTKPFQPVEMLSAIDALLH